MKILSALLAVATVGQAALVTPKVGKAQREETKKSSLAYCLDPNLVQSASNKTGQEEGSKGLAPGEMPSATDEANFINFCAGHELTNGRQLSTSSCNGIPMGRLPDKDHMVSALITRPTTGARLSAHTTFNITIQTVNLAAGQFVNPQVNYYTAPQDLDADGHVYGHCHVTVQRLDGMEQPQSVTPWPLQKRAKTFPAPQVPDPREFVFFKGINDVGDGHGKLQATVTGGLPPGLYRVCTMIAARNHQPVMMPVAQRGAQDDCVRFVVVPIDEE